MLGGFTGIDTFINVVVTSYLCSVVVCGLGRHGIDKRRDPVNSVHTHNGDLRCQQRSTYVHEDLYGATDMLATVKAKLLDGHSS